MYVDTLFPNLKLIHGMQKSIQRPTVIVGNLNTEYRLTKISNFRTTWTWPSRAMLASDRKALATFYTDVANFALNSFKFKDPDGSSWVLSNLKYTGNGNYFYCTSGESSSHPIFHPGPDTVIKSGSTSVPFTFEIVNGVPCFKVPGYTSGLTVSGTYYYAVRFDQASIGWTMEALASDNSAYVDNLGDITLIEVFEY